MITRNFYDMPNYPLRIKTAAFEQPTTITFKNGAFAKVIFTKVTKDSITFVNLDNKESDPVIQTIPFSDIMYLEVYEGWENEQVTYTFIKK